MFFGSSSFDPTACGNIIGYGNLAGNCAPMVNARTNAIHASVIVAALFSEQPKPIRKRPIKAARKSPFQREEQDEKVVRVEDRIKK